MVPSKGEIDFIKTSVFITTVAAIVAVGLLIGFGVGIRATYNLADRIDSTTNVLFQNVEKMQSQLDDIQEALNETD